MPNMSNMPPLVATAAPVVQVQTPVPVQGTAMVPVNGPLQQTPSTAGQVMTAGTSLSFVGGLTILITLTLEHYNVQVPAVGATAMIAVLGPIAHFVAIKLGMNK